MFAKFCRLLNHMFYEMQESSYYIRSVKIHNFDYIIFSKPFTDKQVFYDKFSCGNFFCLSVCSTLPIFFFVNCTDRKVFSVPIFSETR